MNRDPPRVMSGKRDSNPRPSAWEADALPTELLPQKSPLLKENPQRVGD